MSKHKLCGGVMVFELATGVAMGAMVAPSGAASHPKAAAFTSWANKIRGELAVCEAGTVDTGIALSKMIQSSATASDFVSGSLAAKNAAPGCSITSNNGILDINTTNPPSGYPTLKSITSDLQIWADQDDQQVIIDVGKVANSNGNSTSAISSLISDAAEF